MHTAWMFLWTASPGYAPRFAAWVDPVRNFVFGVDLFFVLSGFLVGAILIRQYSASDVRYGAFYVRRSFRIFPAYYVVLLLSLFVFSRLRFGSFPLIYENAPWTDLWARSWSSFLYLSNYFHGHDANILKIGWSLCIEEHFYLLLPVVLGGAFAVRRDWMRIGILCLGILLPLLARTHAALTASHLEDLLAIDAETHFRMDGLFMGVLLAFLHVRHRDWIFGVVRRFRWPVLLVGVFGFGGVLTRLLPFSALGLHTLQYSVASLGATALIATGLYVDGPLSRFLGSRVFVPFARVAYGTYLLHLFVIAAILTLETRAGSIDYISRTRMLGIYAAAQILAPAAAALMFLTLEQPLQRLGRRLTGESAPRA